MVCWNNPAGMTAFPFEPAELLIEGAKTIARRIKWGRQRATVSVWWTPWQPLRGTSLSRTFWHAAPQVATMQTGFIGKTVMATQRCAKTFSWTSTRPQRMAVESTKALSWITGRSPRGFLPVMRPAIPYSHLTWIEGSEGIATFGLSGSLPDRAIGPILNNDPKRIELVADPIRSGVISC